jgi:hypothetical protein
MAFDIEALKQQIPYYLTADPAKRELINQLSLLSTGAEKGYFITKISDPNSGDVLQGDCWTGFQNLSFKSGSRRVISGIVLSNTCDISPENPRTLPLNVTFAPIVKVSKIKSRFEAMGLGSSQIAAKLDAIRSQSVTSIFYLPADGPLDEPYAVLLDDIHSMPVEILAFNSEKLLTLSMAGFYLFVFKLSVHFCRLQENVDRSPLS